MSREDAIRVEGTIVEVLPNTVYRVALPNGHRVLTHVSGRVRLEISGIHLGDKVTVEMSPYDLSTGCITCR
ncbi:MAG: translation initiation factor IF-1 [Candidatus Woesebacteria bacterium]|nr:translation initiation factor IF-1 [Candidatus Woesebacteria bacterium]